MKKTIASILLAAMVFTTAGCGGGQTAEDAKKDASAAVEDAANKAKEVTQDAANAVSNALDSAKAMADDAAKVMSSIQSGDRTAPALGGIVPGVNLDTATNLLGAPISNSNGKVEFENGLDAQIDKDNTVQEVSTTFEGISTPAGVSIGMADYTLNDSYGNASSVTNENGDTVYKYLSKDNRRVLEFVTRDGVIREIRCSFNK